MRHSKCPVCNADPLLEHITGLAKMGGVIHLTELLARKYYLPIKELDTLQPIELYKRALEVGFEFDTDFLATIKEELEKE